MSEGADEHEGAREPTAASLRSLMDGLGILKPDTDPDTLIGPVENLVDLLRSSPAPSKGEGEEILRVLADLLASLYSSSLRLSPLPPHFHKTGTLGPPGHKPIFEAIRAAVQEIVTEPCNLEWWRQVLELSNPGPDRVEEEEVPEDVVMAKQVELNFALEKFLATKDMPKVRNVSMFEETSFTFESCG